MSRRLRGAGLVWSAVMVAVGGVACSPTAAPPATTTRSASQVAQAATVAPAAAPAAGGAGAHAHSHGELVLSLADAAAEAKRIDGLGAYGRRVDTDVAEAQAFFNQGMRLYWAFNHDEAYRSFARAAIRDPRCTLCAWGAALTLGPNYNMPMLPDRAKAAWDALLRAHMLAPSSRPVERALVGALGARYRGPAPVDEKTMGQQNIAYAAAMRQVQKQFPDDADVQSLYAEALMIINPWKLWTREGIPAPGTTEIVTTLESVLAKAPDHPGANHLYVHAVEASNTPGRGVPAADRLGPMMPNAGHLVHMPSHIYQRVGRYEDAAAANRRAMEADRRYAELIAPRPPPRIYEMYMGHNAQFLAYADSMQGFSGESIAAAEKGGMLSRDAVTAMPMIDLYAALPHVMLMRFGKWEEVLAAAPPDPAFPTATGLWHHARGMAHLATGRAEEARLELEQLYESTRALPPHHPAMNNQASDVLAIAALVLEGKLAEQRGDPATAVDRLSEAVRQEGELAYNEPPDWWYPVRHVLGATLISMRKPNEAEAVYRADLRVHPENGWSLAGLAKALKAQGKTAEAKTVLERARLAWRRADIPLTGSWPSTPSN
jgi:tetratricopeptide (TPR) repeat protein